MSETVGVVELLKQYAAGAVDLAALEKQIADGYDLATDVSDNLDAIKADPEASAGLVMAFCVSRPCSETENDDEDAYSIKGRTYPIAAVLNEDDRYEIWSALPGLVRSFIDSPPEGFEADARAVEAEIVTLVSERYETPGFWTPDDTNPNWDERAAWVEADLWNDDLEAAADADNATEDEEPPEDEQDGGGDDTEDEQPPEDGQDGDGNDEAAAEDEAEAEAELEEGVGELLEVEHELEGEQPEDPDTETEEE